MSVSIPGKFLFLLIVVSLLLTPAPVHSRLGILSRPPDWSRLDKYQQSITRDTFARLLRETYALNGAAYGAIWIDRTHALIRKKTGELDFYRFNFAPSETHRREVPVLWRPVIPGELAGRKIALDPGHLGGPWAKMEERWFQIGTSTPVTEGDMTLLVAQHLADRLTKAGATVQWVRQTTEPLTSARPESLLDDARKNLAQRNLPLLDAANPQRNPVQSEAERLFYRLSEIRERARRNNDVLRPDLTICIHFNAEAWGDPTAPTFVENNHLHLLINGHYSRNEIALDDVRFEMIEKLLTLSAGEEIRQSERIAASLARATGLPPYTYTRPVAVLVPGSRYVWARNLLANRLYRNPTIFLEPYVMNHEEVFERVQMGDYEGEREVRGVKRKSIYREYADAVADALIAAPPSPP